MSTTQVIEGGFKWSQDKANRAYEKGTFIRVGGEKTASRKLSGAKKSWDNVADKKEFDTIFVTSVALSDGSVQQLRLTGTTADVIRALRDNGAEEDLIKAALDGQINKNNAVNNPDFAEEIMHAANVKKVAVKSVVPLTDAQLEKYAKAVKSKDGFQLVAKTTGAKAAPAVARKTRAVSLKAKFDSLKPGQVLNVSNLASDLTGARTQNAPKTAKTTIGMRGHALLNLYSLVSSNQANYEAAVRALYGDASYNQHRNEIVAMFQGKPVAKLPGASVAAPVAVTRTSPSKSQASPKVRSSGAPILPGVPKV